MTTAVKASKTPRDDIEAPRQRQTKAEWDRDTWRAGGLQDKDLAADFAVEALELQLHERLRAPSG